MDVWLTETSSVEGSVKVQRTKSPNDSDKGVGDNLNYLDQRYTKIRLKKNLCRVDRSGTESFDKDTVV